MGGNRLPLSNFQQNSISKAWFLHKLFNKHLVILDSIVHENVVELWWNSANWITREWIKRSKTRFTRDHILKIKNQAQFMDQRYLPLQIFNSLQILQALTQDPNPLSLDLYNWWRTKNVDGGLAQELVRFNVKTH